jgi:hypothetical protein
VDEERGVVGREAEDDLADGVFHKLLWGAGFLLPGFATSPAAASRGLRHRGAREVLELARRRGASGGVDPMGPPWALLGLD